MTRTGIFIRRAVRPTASPHWRPLTRSTSRESRAATNTPVPAADSQLIVKRAASGFASGLTTGGVRWTLLWSAGMSHAGRESVPLNGDPRSVVSILTVWNTLFSFVFQVGIPQRPQQRIRIAHGGQAYAVWR